MITQNETVNNKKRCPDVNRLSKLQKQVLVAVWRELRGIERHFEKNGTNSVFRDDRRGNWHGEFGGRGCRPSVGWQWQIVFDEPPTRSQCAALSRALRRLEDRGLVERSSTWDTNMRTVALCVTDRGRKVASQLAGEKDPYPSVKKWVHVCPRNTPTDR